MSNIRNFLITAHIDHGKSTLADRMLEITGTVHKREMQAQFLDQMDIERERGITIKMAPVRMLYTINAIPYTLNLIDTPGHSDFAYEVSRALFAVEGAILLVDSTQGIQAQTLANFHAAKRVNLKIIGAVSKIDMNPVSVETIIADMAKLIGCEPGEIYRVSGKTGEGVPELLDAVINKLPPPQKPPEVGDKKAALIFDSFYDDHKGIVTHVRVFGGTFKRDDTVKLAAVNELLKIKEVGYFSPKLRTCDVLREGEIGYIATGIKDPNKLKIGDTIGEVLLSGYKEPKPVVFVALYPNEESDYEDFKSALHRLKLNDASFNFEPDMSEVLGRGFRCGFLGRLHFEIIAERLKREFNLQTISSFPSVSYRVKIGGNWQEVKTPKDFPSDYDDAMEPIVKIEIVTPVAYLGSIMQLQNTFHLKNFSTESFQDYNIVTAKLPLSDLISDFDDKLKSVSSGYASFSYELSGEERADLTKLEILVAGEVVPGLTRIVRRDEAEREGRQMLTRLKDLLPKQQFAQSLQAQSFGRILAREDIPAMKKDVTGYLYGGDRTRKMKLWKKQQRGKKRLKVTGRVEIEPSVFKELLKR
ncbi:MAG: elongation factor 4 [Candidatus Liptonbacteria bacterium]|nr:elongation factor 4 [Candidatus Liptonbacteria bacterium]